MSGQRWSRDEFLITMDLYFNEDIVEDASDPAVEETAKLIGRTPDSVALRLANYRHLDPGATQGMENTGQDCVEIWQEFYGNEEQLRRAAEGARRRLAAGGSEGAQQTTRESDSGSRTPSDGDPAASTPVSTGENTAEIPTRYGQQDFRMAVRERYDDTCLLCDVDDSGLLQAGHILPWSDYEAARGAPSNGLLLCYTHHRAFDIKSFTITENYELRVRAGYDTESEFLQTTMIAADGTELSFPHDPPAAEHLRRYNEEEVFWYDTD